MFLFGLTGLNAREPQHKRFPTKIGGRSTHPWLLDEGQELRGIAFSGVIFDTTGKRVCRSTE
jgi:hypothetical protein